jgi:hypothetical protein
MHDLILQRESIMDEVDQWIDRWPERKNPEFTKGLLAAANRIGDLIGKLADANIDTIEVVRAFRYKGNIYHELGYSMGVSMFAKAEQAYAMANELLLKTPDTVEQAKLDLAWANTSRFLYKDDAGKLREALKKSMGAAQVLTHPDQINVQKQIVNSLEVLSATADSLNELKEADLKIKGINDRINNGSSDKSALPKDISDVKAMIEKILGQAGTQLNKLMNQGVSDPRLEQVEDELKKLLKEVTPMEMTFVELLEARLASEATDGKVSPVRTRALEMLIEQIKQVFRSPQSDLQDQASNMQKLKDLMGQATPFLAKPSFGIPEPSEGTNASAYLNLISELKGAILVELIAPGKSSHESEESLNLYPIASEVERALYEAQDSDKLADQIFKDQIIPLALRIRKFTNRKHFMLAQPLWGSLSAVTDPSVVSYSGPSSMQTAVSASAAALDIRVLSTGSLESFSLNRFEKICRSAACIFDFSGTNLERAGVAFELGIAMALGNPIVITCEEGVELPFDVDIAPIVYKDANSAEPSIRKAITEALIWVNPKNKRDGYHSTLAHVLKFDKRPSNDYVNQTLKMIERSDKSDAVLALRNTQLLISYLNNEYQLIYPRWIPVYEGEAKTIFHIMPFSETWSPKVMDAVWSATTLVNAEYVRGDTPHPGDKNTSNILQFIWEKIASSSMIVADLSAFNANVFFELGLALTIGKKVLMVAHKSALKDIHIFRMISKERIAVYNSFEELQEITSRFLSFRS